MATSFYDTARDAFAKAQINWLTDDIRLLLIDSALYTVNFTTHAFLSEVAAGARIATVALAGKTCPGAGVMDANDSTFTAVAGTTTCEALIVYKHTGVEGTSQLICYIDSVGASTFPITTNGNNITVTWHATNGVCKLKA